MLGELWGNLMRMLREPQRDFRGMIEEPQWNLRGTLEELYETIRGTGLRLGTQMEMSFSDTSGAINVS